MWSVSLANSFYLKKLLWLCSISALPGKSLNDVLSFPMFPSFWRGKQVARELRVDRTCPTFIVCRSPVRIWAWRFCIYTDIASGFPKTLQSNAGMILQMGLNYSWFQTSAVLCMLYVFFWVIPRRLNFICRRSGTLCLFRLHRQVGVEWHNYFQIVSNLSSTNHLQFKISSQT
jgi:hypothetical protein